jgi:hypothetical protein
MTGFFRFTIFITPTEETNDVTLSGRGIGKPLFPVNCLIAQISHDQPAAAARLQYAV